MCWLGQLPETWAFQVSEKTWQPAPESASGQLLETDIKSNSVDNSHNRIQEGHFISSLERFKEVTSDHYVFTRYFYIILALVCMSTSFFHFFLDIRTFISFFSFSPVKAPSAIKSSQPKHAVVVLHRYGKISVLLLQKKQVLKKKSTVVRGNHEALSSYVLSHSNPIY